MRALIKEELGSQLQWQIQACSREDLAANPGLAIGALGVTPQHALRDVSAIFPKERPIVSLRYSSADEHLRTIRALRAPSVVAVVSGSEMFLQVARSLLASALGSRHELKEIVLPNETLSAAHAADLVFCDSIAKKQLRTVKAIHYRLLPDESIKDVASRMNEQQK